MLVKHSQFSIPVQGLSNINEQLNIMVQISKVHFKISTYKAHSVAILQVLIIYVMLHNRESIHYKVTSITTKTTFLTISIKIQEML